jgi:hypothetical protein
VFDDMEVQKSTMKKKTTRMNVEKPSKLASRAQGTLMMTG